MRRWVLACSCLLGCVGCVAPAAPPPDLPPLPAPSVSPAGNAATAAPPGEGRAPVAETSGGESGLPSRPRATGDRERDALSLGFWGCRVMARRITPLASGKAVLRVHLGADGDVLALGVWSEGLAQTVLDCVTRTVRGTHFDPRRGSAEVVIPFDLAGGDAPIPVAAPPGNVSM